MMLTLCLAMPLAGCESSGPKGACDRAASALEKKDSALFMSQFDMDAYAYHEFVNLSKDNGLMKLTDLIGSLCDLTSGSGDKGTPIVFIQGYFDNYTEK